MLLISLLRRCHGPQNILELRAPAASITVQNQIKHRDSHWYPGDKRWMLDVKKKKKTQKPPHNRHKRKLPGMGALSLCLGRNRWYLSKQTALGSWWTCPSSWAPSLHLARPHLLQKANGCSHLQRLDAQLGFRVSVQLPAVAAHNVWGFHLAC